ncbi:rhomboid-like protein [Streptomyces sp. NPDC058284]|uniref:rhomboid-like protein n=1 Tax=unclassified Streptomyces TaxID=2593676 RepID=UPI00364E87EE
MNQRVQPAGAAPDARTPGPATPGAEPSGTPATETTEVPRTLDGIPQQSTRRCEPPSAGTAARTATRTGPVSGPLAAPGLARIRALPKVWRLLPTPTGTPFTFGYALVLAVTSMVMQHADPDLVYSLLQGSSTDVAHLAHSPALVLVASALWIAGGVTSPYAIGFLLVLTALERRIGGIRAAGVFLLGHVVATLVTEVPVAFSVLAGQLPGSSLHRLDYGISFGVAASVGALAGLLSPWPRWAVLAGFGWMLVEDLIEFADPMTNWGHLLALLIGVSTWPLLRRGRQPAGPVRGAAATGQDRRRPQRPQRAEAGPHRAR